MNSMSTRSQFRLWLFSILAFLLLASEKCQDKSKSNDSSSTVSQSSADKLQEMKDLLCRKWILETRQDNGKLAIYRPEGFDLPPSRGRTG